MIGAFILSLRAGSVKARGWDGRLAGGPCLSQGLPADQGAPEREEGLVNVGPFVVPHAQPAELIESYYNRPPSAISGAADNERPGSNSEETGH